MIWTVVASAASVCFCRVLVVALKLAFAQPLWVPSFHPPWVRSFTLVLVKAAGDFSSLSSVRRALHDVLMALHERLRGELFACVQHTHSRAARGLLA